MILVQHKTKNRDRQGFTLIELLVVILIIGILASLIGAAVIRALTTGKQARNRSEISQLENALEQFKNRFGVYPPSRIKLCESYASYGSTQLDIDSVAFLTKVFPRIDTTGIWTSPGIDWNGNGVLDGPVVLEGDQCLVFFLGGIPGNSIPLQCIGFSTNPKDPSDKTTADRIGPFFDFPSNRLVLIQVPLPPNVNNPLSRSPSHYSFLDNNGQSDGQGNRLAGMPYAYFSSYKATNGYNRYYNAGSYPYSDCPNLMFLQQSNQPPLPMVWPYAEIASPLKYWKSNSFQIISAGADGVFGQGGIPIANGVVTWTPATAGSIYAQGSPGYDDQSNFTGSLLGVGQD